MSGIGFIFCGESVHLTPDVIFIVCALIDNSYEPINMQEYYSYKF